MIQHEAILHQHVADYLKLQYPGVIYRTDFAAGIKMTIGQAKKHKRLQQDKAYPDLFIAKPWRTPRGFKYAGCFIELKHPLGGHQPYLKDGVTRSQDKHCLAQWATLDELTELGYYCRMAVGFEQAKAIIDWFLRADPRRPEPTAAAFAENEEGGLQNLF